MEQLSSINEAYRLKVASGEIKVSNEPKIPQVIPQTPANQDIVDLSTKKSSNKKKIAIGIMAAVALGAGLFAAYRTGAFAKLGAKKIQRAANNIQREGVSLFEESNRLKAEAEKKLQDAKSLIEQGRKNGFQEVVENGNVIRRFEDGVMTEFNSHGRVIRKTSTLGTDWTRIDTIDEFIQDIHNRYSFADISPKNRKGCGVVSAISENIKNVTQDCVVEADRHFEFFNNDYFKYVDGLQGSGAKKEFLISGGKAFRYSENVDRQTTDKIFKFDSKGILEKYTEGLNPLEGSAKREFSFYDELLHTFKKGITRDGASRIVKFDADGKYLSPARERAILEAQHAAQSANGAN